METCQTWNEIESVDYRTKLNSKEFAFLILSMSSNIIKVARSSQTRDSKYFKINFC